MKIEESFRVSLLVDFYKNLLTEKQRKIITDFIDNNISISELAQIYNTSRQAINDLIKRTIKVLVGYEEKLNLLHKFEMIREKVKKSLEILDSKETNSSNEIKKELNSVLEIM